MSASLIASYVFTYFVLLVVVPLILVTFTMTCIKFFKSTVDDNSLIGFKINTNNTTPKTTEFFNNLTGIVKGKYNIVYGTNLDSIVSLDKESDQAHAYLKKCHLDYVLLDAKSLDIKFVITDPQHNSPECNEFIDSSLSKLGVKVLHLKTDLQCFNELADEKLIAA